MGASLSVPRWRAVSCTSRMGAAWRASSKNISKKSPMRYIRRASGCCALTSRYWRIIGVRDMTGRLDMRGGSIRCGKREKAPPAGEIRRIRPIAPIRPIGAPGPPRYISSMHLLALDTGSPLVSVALARDGAVAASRSVAQERSSTRLLEMVQEVLDEAGIGRGDL